MGFPWQNHCLNYFRSQKTHKVNILPDSRLFISLNSGNRVPVHQKWRETMGA